MALAQALTRGSTGKLNSSATRARSSVTTGGLGGQLHERQRLRGPQANWAAELRMERFPVQDYVRIVAFDGDLVRFLEMDAAHLVPSELARQVGSDCTEHRRRPMLDRQQLQRPRPMPLERVDQQHFLQRGHGEKREPAVALAFIVADRE